jgi:delta1-piperideine-2-carboxylate reductase
VTAQSTISIDELTELVAAIFRCRGMAASDAKVMAGTVVAAERDGARGHGLQRMRGYVSSMEAGWVDPRAEPTFEQRRPGLLAADAANGFAQIALARARERLLRMVQENGTAILATRNSHHFAALWPDIEPFAEAGLIALSMANTRPWMAAWGGRRRAFGTNPVAFACPVPGASPLVWDQASSVMSQGEVLVHRASGWMLPGGTGIDRAGDPTTEPDAVLDGGALLPFAGAKGASVAFMVEILVAAFGGGSFGFEDRSASTPGAVTSNAGQFLLLIDPAAAGVMAFGSRVAALIAFIRASGSQRLPGDRRYAARQQSVLNGIAVSPAMLAGLHRLAGAG